MEWSDTISMSDMDIYPQYATAMDLQENPDTKSFYWSVLTAPIVGETERETAGTIKPDIKGSAFDDVLLKQWTTLGEADSTDEFLDELDNLDYQTPRVPVPFADLPAHQELADECWSTPWSYMSSYEAQMMLPPHAGSSEVTPQKGEIEQVVQTPQRPAFINLPSLMMEPEDEGSPHYFHPSIRRSQLLVNSPSSDAYQNPSTDHRRLSTTETMSQSSDSERTSSLSPSTIFGLGSSPSSNPSSPETSEPEEPQTEHRGHQVGINHTTGQQTLVGRFPAIIIELPKRAKIYKCPHPDCQHYVWSTQNGYKYHLQHGCPQNPDSAFNILPKVKKTESKPYKKLCAYCNGCFTSPNGYKLHVEKNQTTAGGKCKDTARGRQAQLV